MAIKFDPLRNPEENIAAFFAYLKQQDAELGQLLESKLQSRTELTPKDRTSIAKQAVEILRGRLGGGNNA